MKKIFKSLPFFLSLSFLFFLVLTPDVFAVCPVCTVAVTAGLGLSRYLGIDDLISGLWVGALILSSSFWLSDWLSRKYQKKVRYQTPLIAVLFYLLTLLPLYYYGLVGHPDNTFWGIDKLILGTLIGSLVFLFAVWMDKKVRQLKGKQLFIYQKVIFPVSFLTILSMILYFVI